MTGIEWDVWGRGLNDGSVVLPGSERVTYFAGPAGRKRTAAAATSGVVSSPASPTRTGTLEFKCSFVKASKFSAKRPCSLVERLQERYGHPESSHAAPLSAAQDVVTAGEVGTTLGSQKPIELVGVEKLKTQQTLATVEKITLAHCQIATLGFEMLGELHALTPSISEINLSFNLFESWTPVFRIVQELPALETLILSGNRLQYDLPSAAAGSGQEQDAISSMWRFPNVKSLVLNQTLVSWQDLLMLLDHHFPQLEELHLVENDYSDADFALLSEAKESTAQETRSWMQSLEVLDLSQNRLRSWTNLRETVGASLVNLKQLVVNSNDISTLVTATTDSSATDVVQAFQQLRGLSISDNRIDSWTSIDALNQYPQLDTLRFTRNPLIAHMGAGEVRMIIIARTDFIASINGSGVRAKERQDAEQMYLKRILHELAAVGDGNTEEQSRVLASHPRFGRLRQLYPDLQIGGGSAHGSTGSGGGPATLGSSLIQVKIVPMSMQATSFDPLTKKIPEKMKIAQLKLLIEKKFGVEAPSQSLSFRPDSRVRPWMLYCCGCVGFVDCVVIANLLCVRRVCRVRWTTTTRRSGTTDFRYAARREALSLSLFCT